MIDQKQREEVLKWLMMPQASIFLDLLEEAMNHHLDQANRERFERMSIFSPNPTDCENGSTVFQMGKALACRVTIEKIREIASEIKPANNNE
jgi:hypothetical protein